MKIRQEGVREKKNKKVNPGIKRNSEMEKGSWVGHRF
jgi:hypothetical protein